MKRQLLTSLIVLLLLPLNAQIKELYTSSGTEIIFSGASVQFKGEEVNTNMRFTVFFHFQQQLHFDLSNKVGLYTGLGIRNVGLILEDYYQKVGYDVDPEHPNYNKNTKIKHRSYALGFPLAIKLGSFDNNYFFYAGGEYEWMFAYKQKKFIDDVKEKFTDWNSDRVTTWMPSLFVGVRLPYGTDLKFKYYMDDFLNKDFAGQDFGEDVDYSNFNQTGMWYISLSYFFNWK